MKYALKKHVLAFCTLVLLSVGLCLSVSAVQTGDTFTEGLYTYEITSLNASGSVKGEVTLCDVDSSAKGTLTVPSLAKNYKVTAIGEYAFAFCDGIKVLTLPDTLTHIGIYAFTYCTGLEDLTVPPSLKSSDMGAFLGCTALKKVRVPNLNFWVNIDFGESEPERSFDPTSNPLYYNAALYIGGKTDKNLVIPTGTTVVKKAAFAGCSSYTSIIVPDGLSVIEDGAFCNSTSLSGVVWSNSVTKVGKDVFANCPSLDKMYLRDLKSWTKIDFETIPVASLYLNGVLVENLFIPSGTKVIGKDDFRNCTGIRNIIIPEGVKEIEEGAFCAIDTLEAVILPKSIEKIADGAFDSQSFKVYYIGSEKEWKAVDTTENSGIKGNVIYDYPLDHIHDYRETVEAATYKENGKKVFSCRYCEDSYSEELSRLTLPKVSGLKVKSVNTTDISLTWTAVEGVDGYTVYYSKDGKTWLKKSASKASLTVKKLSSGTAYRFKVKAVAGEFTGKESSVVKTATKVKKVTLSSVKSSKAKQLTATWKTVSGANGYVLEYSTSKKFTSKTTKKVTLAKSGTKKTTVKKLKSKKKYYVRIRAYKTVNGKKVYGSYSTVKNVTVK